MPRRLSRCSRPSGACHRWMASTRRSRRCFGPMLDPDAPGRPAATAVATALARIVDRVAPVDGDAIPEEGTVVMATAVPSRAAGRRQRAGCHGPIPPDPAPASRAVAPAAAPVRRRRPVMATRGSGMPAPAVLAVGLLLLAAVVLGASAFGSPTAEARDASAPPAGTVEATPAPTVTTAPDEEGGGNDGAATRTRTGTRTERARARGTATGTAAATATDGRHAHSHEVSVLTEVRNGRRMSAWMTGRPRSSRRWAST